MSTYQFQGVPLTSGVFASVLPDVVPPNQPMTRLAISVKVSEYHATHGGLPSVGDPMQVAKKALSELAAGGLVASPTKGWWKVLERIDPEAELVVIGTGTQSVYVYYFTAWRDQALHFKRDSWPMKIGMTVGKVETRVRDQIGTAMPELPIVGLIYRTDDAANAERLLHSTLKTRGRQLSGPGKEWFQTSLTEVKEILDFATSQ